MGTSIEVNSANFQEEVVDASYQRPVLIDFFATWCGPCQLLKPMLEKLVNEYDFVLAKVDIDRNPELAQAYHVEGVPDVRVVQEGKMYSGFVGVLPEPKLREFLGQLNVQSGLNDGLVAIQAAIASGQTEQAKALFSQMIEQYPQSRELAILAARFLIEQDKLGAAEKLLSSIEEHEKPFFTQAEALRQLIQLKSDIQKPPTHELDPAFYQAANQILLGDYESALQGLLDIVSKNRKYRDDGARKTMLMVFGLLGDDHPLSKHYRKQLTLILY